VSNILVTGAAGYVGTPLTARLLAHGHNVLAYDSMLYGNDLAPHPRLKIIEADIRDTERLADALWGVDAVLHLACISNDPSFELDEKLSETINFDCFEPMVKAAKARGVQRFIYASSSSVYGVSDAPDVTEDHPLLPLTLYSKFKGMCEEVLERYRSPDFVTVTIRPATVCGYSPHMRLDLSVNILTAHAVNNRKITVFGGTQKRPNLHIEDMIDAYELLLAADPAIVSGAIYNIGAQNLPIAEIADMARTIVQREFPEFGAIEIVTTPTNDLRSYHVNSDKIFRALGFHPKRGVEDAVRDICAAFRAGKIPNAMTDPRYHNVKILKAKGAA
jgi:nucleoside-diphosphate-sugar epimerase